MRKFKIILLVILAGAWFYFGNLSYNGLGAVQQLANYHEGILSLKGLPANDNMILDHTGFDAQVHIDTLGIPHIFSNDPAAIAYAMGYMHARDRYFQMELIVNTVKGELASMIGEPGIGSDRNWKKHELADKAKQFIAGLAATAPDLYQYLVAYANGVNAYVGNEPASNRDPMYAIWDCSPRPWHAQNVFFIQWYMSSQLAQYDDYFDRQEVLDKLPDTVRKILYPQQPATGPYIIPGNRPLRQQAGNQAAVVRLFNAAQPNTYVPKAFDPSMGSNNWVINGTRTKSGELFLCNDLHLPLTSPDIFYELQVSAPGMHAYGFTIPGVPLILTGHNENIAWGITNGGWDVTEPYLLKVDPGNQEQYWLDGQWRQMDKKEFTVHVKGGKDEHVTARYTVFGPASRHDSVFYATTWYPAQSCNAIGSFWKLLHARDWSGFKDALRSYDYPSQNFAYADVQGNIGMVCAGKMIVKPAGYAGGLLDGTRSVTPTYIHFDSLPQVLNPARGYLFSANQQPLQSRYYLSSRWFDDLYRPRRIREMLASDSAFEFESVRRMQLDVKDLSANDLVVMLDKYFPGKSLSANWEALRNWNGEWTPGSDQVFYFRLFKRASGIVRNDITRQLALRAGPGYDQFLNFLLNDHSFSFAGKNFTGRECFEKILKTADSLYAASGQSAVAKAGFSIPHMTYLPGLAVDVNDVGGNENTINVNYSAHPVIRTIISMKDNAVHSWMVNATGQTGRLNNRNYFQQLSAWKKNEPHKTQFTPIPAKLQYVSETITFTK